MNRTLINRPCISVIVPVYKVEKYLKQCLDSLLDQTYERLEIILVDDGSPDGSGSICDQYARRDSRIKVIHKENGGLSSARNAGLDIATGELLGFVDSDDYCDPDMYEQLFSIMEAGNAEISCCGWYLVDGQEVRPAFLSENVMEMTQKEAVDELFSNVLFRNYMWNKLFRRELFENVRFPVGMTFEDIAISHQIFDRAQKVIFSEKPLYYYRQNGESISNSIKPSLFFDIARALDMRMSSDAAIGREHMMDHFKVAICCLLMQYLIKVEDPLMKKRLMETKKRILKGVSLKSLSGGKKIEFLLLTICPLLYRLIYKFRTRS